jgi:lipid-binding SYLF domain-containing protein
MSRARITAAFVLAMMLVGALAWAIRAESQPRYRDREYDSYGTSERVSHARQAYRQLINTADRGVPEALLQRCKAVAIFPGVLKGAIGFGARYGKGVVVFRSNSGGWSPLAFYTLTGGSWGAQFGAESADVVLFFMTERSARSLLRPGFTLSGKAGVAAGPIGRTAEAGTDPWLRAEIYSYARTRGLFAGISLEGARVSPDLNSNEGYYGERLSPRAILVNHDVPRQPRESRRLLSALPGGPRQF